MTKFPFLNSDSRDQFQAGGGEIEWDKTTQGWILSAFFYGYLVTQVPSGILAGRFGGKRVMLAGVSLFGATTVLVPVAARLVNYNTITPRYKTSYVQLQYWS